VAAHEGNRRHHGRRVDCPERGAATRIAMLSGFSEGWYELIHASGRADRVTWDARKLPFLWFYGEFGATNDAQSIVTRGVAPGDVVVVERNPGIVDGLRVTPTSPPSASPSPGP